MNITLTEFACKKIGSILKENEALLISVQGGGCSGLTYSLQAVKITNDIIANNLIIDVFGVTILTDKKSALFLNGMTLDFSEGLMGKGFEFKNPNAKKSCGCGSSFSVHSR